MLYFPGINICAFYLVPQLYKQVSISEMMLWCREPYSDLDVYVAQSSRWHTSDLHLATVKFKYLFHGGNKVCIQAYKTSV